MNKSLIVLKPNENVYKYSILKNNTGWKLRRTHLTDQTKKKRDLKLTSGFTLIVIYYIYNLIRRIEM